MNEREKIQISKFLSLVLRHEPGKIGVTLDSAGWVEVNTLLEACANHGVEFDRSELEEVVAGNDKRRFAFSEDGQCIRANQGHSVNVALGYLPMVPPARLYHGTAARFIGGIRSLGLVKGERHHVHLSVEPATALDVGRRYGKPVLLVIDAEVMHARGHLFFRSDNGVWLTECVPAEFIDFDNAQKL